MQLAGGGEVGLTFMATQVLQSEESGPEQVAQSAWQAEQVDSEALYSFEAQETQEAGVGWLGFTWLKARQVTHWFELAPVQVAQSP